MGIPSNIVIKSNVYVNKKKAIYDKDFVPQVRGYHALKELEIYLGTSYDGLLTKAQRDEIRFGIPECPDDKSGAKPWGLIIEHNVPVFVCKCEKNDCKRYSVCSNYWEFRKIERTEGTVKNDESQHDAQEFGLLRHLDIEEKNVYRGIEKVSKEGYAPLVVIIKPSKPKNIEEEPQPNENIKTDIIERSIEIVPSAPVRKTPTAQHQTVVAISSEYEKIDKPDKFISCKIDEKVIVNAGPGTGKTYSVIKRLGYIVNNELADLSNVLVLCYSKSAVAVIKKRINDEIREGNIPVEATQLFNGIRTFDSFVTYMLFDGEIEEMISNLTYDERIEKFIDEIQKDKTVFDGLEYLIVDEMQDLVGTRARMVQSILKQINCGFLLLGDMCQSIYDYQIKDENELNSFRYYKWLNAKFTTGVKRFELTKNMRQSEELTMFTEYLRNAILSENAEKQAEDLALCISTLQQENNIGNIKKIEKSNISKSTAILCRNNAQVSISSSELFAKGIEHRIAKRAQHSDIVPWIAEILSTYTESRIGITAFRERVLAAKYKDADAKWQLLKIVAKDDNEKVLDIKLLVKELAAGKELPLELDLASRDVATVSTIHRAKGREYENVLLLSDDYNTNGNTLDEIKVAYVALTRGKEKISFCEHPLCYKRQLDSNRWIATGKNRKSNKYHCSNFDIGLDGDINPCSFVNKNIEDAITRQKYIATLRSGDPLDVCRIDHAYKIFHEGVYIGMLADNIFHELRDAMEKTNNSPSLPTHMSNIYVNNVVTIASTIFNDVIAEPYNKSGLWLGIEISGFAKMSWS